ncbi:glycoside hydrolase family 104 protein [Acinetobacter sp. WCHAc060025]|uniref:glycoside hydrolase family 24 protein n=1 Tax=Acinetobacter sp. WCHAc060025 TaxID=2518625 RepID=UPI00102361FE|nr:glycoside hydrolase family 104 protein [Acinetobacter sp. WCHAc060025]RZG74730.1 lysozyme [Acinetobacter sp. WCHAc060025]
MAKLSQLQQAYSNPNMRKMLNLIAASEGVKYGYNTLFGNQHFDNLSTHPNIRKAFKQTDGATNYTTAAGRYQFLKSTWDNTAQKYGFKDFSPQNQDLAAISLIAGRGALDDVLKGDFKNAISKLGPEWASLPSSTYKQGKRSWDFVNKQLGQDVGGVSELYNPQMVDLKKVGINQPSYKPEFTDLNSVGIQANKQQSYQPEMVDLKSVGIG